VSTTALLLGVSLGACSSSSDGSGTSPDTDSGKVDAGGDTAPIVPPPLTVLDKDKLDVPPDFTCIGKGGPPTNPPDADAGADGGGPSPAGTLIDVTFKLTEFGGGSSDIVVGAKVDVFYKNTLSPDVPDLKEQVTDDKGTFTLKLPAGKPFAFRVAANDLLRTFVQFDELAPWITGDRFEGVAITKSKYEQFALAITNKSGFLPAEGTGIVAGRIRDCQRHDVRNAVLKLIDVDTGKELPTGKSDTEMKPVHYLTDSELPSPPGTVWSSRSGLFAVINVPETTTSGKHFRAIAYGVYGDSKEVREFASRDLEVTPIAVNSQFIDPK
jgi:hypothetical protein